MTFVWFGKKSCLLLAFILESHFLMAKLAGTPKQANLDPHESGCSWEHERGRSLGEDWPGWYYGEGHFSLGNFSLLKENDFLEVKSNNKMPWAGGGHESTYSLVGKQEKKKQKYQEDEKLRQCWGARNGPWSFGPFPADFLQLRATCMMELKLD